jgi:hypothetical protein
VAQVLNREPRVFQEKKEFGAERSSGDCRRDRRPAQRRSERVAKAAAKFEKNRAGDQVSERLEKEVWFNAIGADVKIDRELDEMDGGDDGAL